MNLLRTTCKILLAGGSHWSRDLTYLEHNINVPWQQKLTLIVQIQTVYESLGVPCGEYVSLVLKQIWKKTNFLSC